MDLWEFVTENFVQIGIYSGKHGLGWQACCWDPNKKIHRSSGTTLACSLSFVSAKDAVQILYEEIHGIVNPEREAKREAAMAELNALYQQ